MAWRLLAKRCTAAATCRRHFMQGRCGEEQARRWRGSGYWSYPSVLLIVDKLCNMDVGTPMAGCRRDWRQTSLAAAGRLERQWRLQWRVDRHASPAPP